MVFNKEAMVNKWQKANQLGLKLTSDLTEFKEHSVNNHIKIYSKGFTEENSNLDIVRGDCLVNQCNAQQFIDMVMNLNVATRQKFDAKTKNMVEFEKWTEGDSSWHIRYMLVSSPSVMVAERDFVSIERVYTTENLEEGVQKITIMCSTSVSDGTDKENDMVFTSDKIPKVGAVRGDNILTFFKMSELTNGDLKVVFVGLTNTNGWIPAVVSNQVIFDRPMNMEGIVKLLGKTLKAFD